ncbi:MAG TPA: hypothetical protein VFR67_06050 [Pilimelia sp.]|nr:hypothetical protein [Pilimelia sp.]
MSTKLSSSLPQGEANGLAAIATALAETPETVHVVIALVDCSKITTNVDNGDVIPTARVRRIEAITDPQDGHRLRQLLRRQWERRTGKTVLPFELEDDLRAAFGDDPGQ